jgi:hypothetical protein
MSTLVAQTISNGTISTSSANVINGAKAWVNFNGSGGASIRASYNVSSVTRTGTGQYTINYTNAFSDANYSIMGITGADSRTVSVGTLATTNSAMRTTNTGGAFEDQSTVTIAVFR